MDLLSAVKEVFSTPSGQKLLELWEKEYCGRLFTDNAHEMYARIGKHEFIQAIKESLGISVVEIQNAAIKLQAEQIDQDPFTDPNIDEE